MSSKNTIFADLAAGVLWGWLSMVVNAVTGIFPPETGFVHDLGTFGLAGAVNAFVAGGLLSIFMTRLPVRSNLLKAVMISVFVWLALRAGAMMLSHIDPERYHVATWESLQGLVLSALLGALIWLGRKVVRNRRAELAC
ncbi:MAG: hypothetical protein A3J24_03890 [Deltaproteobacteria bacterium RIFCSPLOWO2_02_FULL_53_8]|nr:MAG: hypothetical protein A3J24_03890 [Deltaproteobacteria bacterium RIFCSPLOWO2_02_FULL_53_8]